MSSNEQQSAYSTITSPYALQYIGHNVNEQNQNLLRNPPKQNPPQHIQSTCLTNSISGNVISTSTYIGHNANEQNQNPPQNLPQYIHSKSPLLNYPQTNDTKFPGSKLSSYQS